MNPQALSMFFKLVGAQLLASLAETAAEEGLRVGNEYMRNKLIELEVDVDSTPWANFLNAYVENLSGKFSASSMALSMQMTNKIVDKWEDVATKNKNGLKEEFNQQRFVLQGKIAQNKWNLYAKNQLNNQNETMKKISKSRMDRLNTSSQISNGFVNGVGCETAYNTRDVGKQVMPDMSKFSTEDLVMLVNELLNMQKVG